MRVHIELTHPGDFMPLFMIGYEQESDCPLGELALPPWLFIMDHQAGGYLCRHPSALGAVLRVDANRSHAIRDVGPLVRAFRAMAEDPDLDLLCREFPALDHLVYTRGEEYDPTQLAVLEQSISSYIAIPPLQRGIEAFLEHAACDPCDYFLAWNMMSAVLKDPSELVGNLRPSWRQTYDLERDYLLTGWKSDFILSEDMVFDRRRLDELMSVGKQIGHVEPPKVFFLWENSD